MSAADLGALALEHGLRAQLVAFELLAQRVEALTTGGVQLRVVHVTHGEQVYTSHNATGHTQPAGLITQRYRSHTASRSDHTTLQVTHSQQV